MSVPNICQVIKPTFIKLFIRSNIREEYQIDIL